MMEERQAASNLSQNMIAFFGREAFTRAAREDPREGLMFHLHLMEGT